MTNFRSFVYALTSLVLVFFVVFNLKFELFWRLENGSSELGKIIWYFFGKTDIK